MMSLKKQKNEDGLGVGIGVELKEQKYEVGSI